MLPTNSSIGSAGQESSDAELIARMGVMDIDNATKHQCTGDGLTLGADSSNTSFSGSPFHRLPTELLFEIFKTIMELFGVEWSPQHIHQLARVRKAWRDTLLSSPQLWTRITSPAMIDAQLRLSKPSLLDIKVTSKIFRKPENAHPLYSHSERWRSLAIEDKHNFIHGAETTLGKSLPCLEKLQLCNSNPGLQGISIALGEAPRLRDLQLQDVFIRSIYRHSLSSLQSLTMDNERVSMATESRHNLLALLSGCPMLEHLTLRKFISIEGSIETGPHSSPLLPNLKQLILDNVINDDEGVLLRHLSIENLTYFKYQTSRLTQAVLHHLREAVLPILARTTQRELVMRVDDDETHLKVEDCIDIGFEGAEHELRHAGAADTLWQRFYLNPIRRLAIELQLYRFKVTLKIKGVYTPGALALLSSLPPQILNVQTICLATGKYLEECLQATVTVNVHERLLPFASLVRIVIETRNPTNSNFQPYLDVIKAFIQTRNQFVEDFWGVKSRKIFVEWNRVMVFDEQIGGFCTIGALKHIVDRHLASKTCV